MLTHEDYLPYDDSILADRWHWGEAVYGPLYRPSCGNEVDGANYGLLGVAGWRWTELFLLSRGAVTARCDARDDVLVERLRTRGDDHVTNADDLLRVARRYREVAALSPSCEFTLDTSDGPVDLDPFWLRVLQAEADADAVLSVTRQYVGSPRPDVLLVGDTRNVTKRYGNETMLPFMPVDNSSGIWLLEHLSAGFWPRLGIVNGNDLSGNLRNLWEALRRPRPVALGNNAETALRAAGFAETEFTKTTHPAHARRFHRAAGREYAETIERAALEKGVGTRA